MPVTLLRGVAIILPSDQCELKITPDDTKSLIQENLVGDRSAQG